jgi:hypothetical protein
MFSDFITYLTSGFLVNGDFYNIPQLVDQLQQQIFSYLSNGSLTNNHSTQFQRALRLVKRQPGRSGKKQFITGQTLKSSLYFNKSEDVLIN